MSPTVVDQQSPVLVVYKDDIYDVTAFVKRHPGGAALLVDNNRQDITQVMDEAGHSQKAFKLMNKMHVSTVTDWKDPVSGNGFFHAVKDSALDSSDNESDSRGNIKSTKYAPKPGSDFHKQRRTLLLSKYPEIEDLFGPSFVPLLYGSVCFVAFIYVAYYCGQNQGNRGFSSWYFPLVMSWTVLPFLSFGLNNFNHELCHGNTRILGLLTPNDDPSMYSVRLSEMVTKIVLMLNGIVSLNHFQFYYYSTSHKSHHGALGNKSDRGHAFRTLYFSFFQSSEELRQSEISWNVDGDLFGLDPEHLVPDTFASFDSFFDTPNSSDVTSRLCCCYAHASDCSPLIRGIIRTFSLSFIFILLRILGDFWTIMNTFCISPCLVCVKLRRPFDVEMFCSSVGLFVAHFCWLSFGGVRSWLAVYISSFAQPTHMPISIYFGYFYGIHGGVEIGMSTMKDDDESSAADLELGNAGLRENTERIVGSTKSEVVDKPLCQVTLSNYSWLMRFITFDQCLHCEHHDFPKIPCHLLGKLHLIAPEFYGFKNGPQRLQLYNYFLSPWVKFIYSKPGTMYGSCSDSLT